MSTQAKINEDLKIAMKSKNEVALRVLRQLKTAITNTALLTGNVDNPVSDADMLVLIRKQVAQRQDSIKQFTDGGRLDLVTGEEAEVAVLELYLPARLSDMEIDAIITQAIADVAALSKKEMGKAIKRAVELAKGAVDNKTISERIGKLLN